MQLATLVVQVVLTVGTVLVALVIVAWLVDNGPGKAIDKHRRKK
jgi:hypothetical protein